MTIVPGKVSAVANEPFEMRVLLTDASGNHLPETSASAVKWTIAPTGATAGTILGARTLVTVTALAVPKFTLTASDPGTGLVATATILPVKLEDLLTEDWIAAPHDAKLAPSLALIDGMGSAYENDELYAFVVAGRLGQLRGGCDPTEAAHCGEVTIFSATRAADRTKVQWTDPQCDIADRRDPPAIPTCTAVATGRIDNPVAVKFNVWVFDPSATAALVNADIGLATAALTNAWSGLSPTIAVNETGETSSLLLDINSDYTCKPTVRTALDAMGLNDFGPNTVTLVVVTEMMTLNSSNVPEPITTPGYSCPATDTDGAISIVAWKYRRNTTLAHEIGHALGPWNASDDWGHVDLVAGLNSSNLMFSTHSNSVLAPRSALTLGQAFRLSLDKGALVRRTGAGTFERCSQAATTARPCPMITKDVWP